MLAQDWMAQHRFATPVWPLAAMAVTLSAANLLADAPSRTRVLATAAGLVALVPTVLGWAQAATEFRRQPTVPMCFVAQNVGQATNRYADVLGVRDGTLLAVDGGGTALSSRLRFVDLSGLADAAVARFWQREDMAGLPPSTAGSEVHSRTRPSSCQRRRAAANSGSRAVK